MQRRRLYLLLHLPVAAWFAALIVVVAAHRFLPAAAWTMVHLLVLGAASSMIYIWSQHFTNTMLRQRDNGVWRWLAVRLLCHTASAVVVVAGMMLSLWPVVLVGGVGVALTALSHGLSLWRQGRGALPARFAPLVRFYVVAAGLLVLGVVVGVLLAHGQPDAALAARLQLAHVTLNVFGWIGLTAIGTLILLWPTVLHARITDATDRLARRSLVLFAVAVLGAAAGLVTDQAALTALGLLAYVAGIVFVAGEGARQWARSASRGFAPWTLACAIAWLTAVLLALGVVTLVSWGDAEALRAVFAHFLPALLVGFAVQLLFGALTYLLPVVLGSGPRRAPLFAHELERGWAFRLIVVNGGVLLYLLPLPSLARVVLSAVVFVVLASFFVLVGRGAVLTRARAQTADQGRPQASGRAARPDASSRSGVNALSGLATAAVAVLVLSVGLGVALDPAAAGIAIGSGSTPSTHVAATGHTTEVDVTMHDMRFTPDSIDVPAGDRLVIHVRNEDDMVHDLTIANGVSTDRLSPSASQTIDVGVISQSLEAWCSIAGHRQLGMVMSIHAVGADDDAEADSDGGMSGGAHGGMHEGTRTDGESAASDVDLTREPGGSFTAKDATLPAADAAPDHSITLRARDVETEVAPGVRQTLWTFDGDVPGPTLRGTVGDTFSITLINEADMGHSIDFHASALAPDEPMRTIQPGESLTYTFTAHRSGAWLYHCATTPMSQHIANGMFGAVIIDPPDLDPVDAEYLFVQSDFYLGEQGGAADLSRIQTQQPDLVGFNGYANQYVYEPIRAQTGDRVRIWVVDAGPNVASAFHVVGAQFDTVYKEGDYRLHDGGSTGTGGAQVLDLAPAQGGFVEFAFPEAGHYSAISHIMSDAEKGARATFAVSDPDDDDSADRG